MVIVVVVARGGEGGQAGRLADVALALVLPRRRADSGGHPTSVGVSKLITLPSALPCQGYVWELSGIWRKRRMEGGRRERYIVRIYYRINQTYFSCLASTVKWREKVCKYGI